MTTTLSTASLSEKIAARREHSNARILLAGIEGSPANFDDFAWPDFESDFTGGSNKFGTTLYLMNGDAGVSSPIAEISRRRGDELTQNTQDIERDAGTAVKEYADSRGQSSLHDKIEQKRREHEKKLIDQNNKYWGDVEDAIKDLPEPVQDKAITLADKVANFASWLWGQISSKIVELAKKAWEWIKQAWEDVKKWIADRYNDLKNFFSNLFG